MTTTTPITELLAPLGFSNLEAEVYTCLLTESPLTSYAVAKRIGKPVANCYKAVDSLLAKGAVMVKDGSTKLVRAVPHDELLNRLEAEFAEHRRAAAEALEKLQGTAPDDGIYTMVQRDQVMARATSMIETATDVIVMDIFPRFVDELRDALEAATRRGVKLAMATYTGDSIPGADVSIQANAQQIMDNLGLQFIAMAVDAKEHLVAIFSEDGEDVHQAIWSASTLLSWENSVYLESNVMFHRLLEALRNGSSREEMIKSIDDWNRKFPLVETPGYKLLTKRFGWSTTSEYRFPEMAGEAS